MEEEELKEFLDKHRGVKIWKEEEIEDFIDKAEGVSGEEGYVKDFEDKKKGTLIEQRPGKSGSIEVRATLCIKNRTPKQFFDFLEDKEYTKHYDSMMKKYEILKTLRKHQTICVYESKPIVKWIINGRDFVYVSLHKEVKPNCYIILNRGCDYDEVYPVPNGTVRGWVHHTLFYAKPHSDNPNDVSVIYMASADGRGNIPQWVANWVTRKFAPGYSKNLINKFLEYDEYLENRRKMKIINKSESDDEKEEDDDDEEEEEEGEKSGEEEEKGESDDGEEEKEEEEESSSSNDDIDDDEEKEDMEEVKEEESSDSCSPTEEEEGEDMEEVKEEESSDSCSSTEEGEGEGERERERDD